MVGLGRWQACVLRAVVNHALVPFQGSSASPTTLTSWWAKPSLIKALRAFHCDVQTDKDDASLRRAIADLATQKHLVDRDRVEHRTRSDCLRRQLVVRLRPPSSTSFISTRTHDVGFDSMFSDLAHLTAELWNQQRPDDLPITSVALRRAESPTEKATWAIVEALDWRVDRYGWLIRYHDFLIRSGQMSQLWEQEQRAAAPEVPTPSGSWMPGFSGIRRLTDTPVIWDKERTSRRRPR